jgi:hypothetical protein
MLSLSERERNPRLNSVVPIAHSMGGPVCLQYVTDQLSKGIALPIAGLLLYGVPSTASELIKDARIVDLSPALRFLFHQFLSLFFTAEQQVSDLAIGSKFLADLRDQWAFRVVNGLTRRLA